MFSRRSAFDSEPNVLSRALRERRAKARPVLDLTISNPTAAGLPYDQARILAALSESAALSYEPEPFGSLRARTRVAAELAQRGIAVDPRRIVLTASTSEAYAMAFKLLCDPGDDVLVPAPSYPLFEHLARLEGVEMRSYALRYDGAWHIDFESIARARGARTRAVVTVSPNNPTGSFVSREELARLGALGLPVLSDEVFATYGFADDARRATSALECRDVLVMALDGLSKLAGLPQLKLGWMALGGPDASVEAALSRLEIIADSYLSVNTPVQVAAPTLLDAAPLTRAAILERVRSNRAWLGALLSGSAATLLHAEGGWYAIVRLPRTRSEDEWALAFLAAGVLVQPGYYYDFDEEAFVVVSLLTPEPAFREGMTRVAGVVAEEAERAGA